MIFYELYDHMFVTWRKLHDGWRDPKSSKVKEATDLFSHSLKLSQIGGLFSLCSDYLTGAQTRTLLSKQTLDSVD
jgi:hypothetical protein